MAQLVARFVRNEEVPGSNPGSSTGLEVGTHAYGRCVPTFVFMELFSSFDPRFLMARTMKLCAFKLQQNFLALRAPGVLPQLPIGSHNAMAWQDDRYRIGGACCSNCPCGVRVAQ